MSYDRSASGEPTKITREDGSYRQIEYDTSLRVEKESFYDATGTLLDEVVYTYDADGNRQTVSGGEAQGTYRYENVHQLTEIDTAQGIETYTYDAGGRVETVSRDGETLRFEYDENDQLTKVWDVNGNPVVEYTYDSEGRRVEVTDAEGKRDVVVAPTRGGLESPFLIVKENDVEAAFAYAGDMPLARVDEAGNPVYYLTDAMGSVIGLVNGNGQEVAEFRYDSFGNLQTPEALPSELGGDFRFQGQWLESNTDLYHFRARYYDPETGRFVSRDPVEVIETVPESSNPYQFVYNNPLVYSDPDGNITINRLNAAQTINKILHNVRRLSLNQAKEELIDQARGIAGQVLEQALSQLIPFNPVTEFLSNQRLRGRGFEGLMMSSLCGAIPLPQGAKNRTWLEVDIEPSGTPGSNGYRCGEPIPSPTQFSRGLGTISILDRNQNPRVDFVFKTKQPALYDRKPPGYLVGDFKLRTEVIDTSKRQWRSIINYAYASWKLNPRTGERGHQYVPMAMYVTLFGNSTHEALVKKEGLKKGVRVEIIEFYERTSPRLPVAF